MVRFGVTLCVLVLASSGCGRLGFEPLRGDAGTPGDGGAADGGAGDGGAGDAGGRDAGSASFCTGLDDLLGCWRFDGDVADGSGAGRDLDVGGVSFAPGRVGAALSRDSGSDVTVPRVEDDAFEDGFAVELFLRVPALPASRAGIADRQRQFGLFLQPDGALTCTAGGSGARCEGLRADAWTHVACTHRGRRVAIHVDGALCDEAPADRPDEGEAPLRIGEDSPGGGDELVGLLDDLRIFTRGRTADEICAAAGREDC